MKDFNKNKKKDTLLTFNTLLSIGRVCFIIGCEKKLKKNNNKKKIIINNKC